MQTYREKKEKRKYSKTHHVPVLEFPMNITSEKWLMATWVSHSVIFSRNTTARGPLTLLPVSTLFFEKNQSYAITF